MKVRAFLGYVARLKGLPPTLIAARVSEVAGLIGLDEATLDRECRHLSHGETRRLGLALPVGCSTGWPPGRPLSLGTGLVLAEPGMEDAYVYRRLRSASGGGAGTG